MHPRRNMEEIRREVLITDVVFRGKLKEAFQSRGRVFRSLPFIAVRQKHHHPDMRSHLASPETMNWSIMICAPLAKSRTGPPKW